MSSKNRDADRALIPQYLEIALSESVRPTSARSWRRLGAALNEAPEHPEQVVVALIDHLVQALHDNAQAAGNGGDSPANAAMTTQPSARQAQPTPTPQSAAASDSCEADGTAVCYALADAFVHDAECSPDSHWPNQAVRAAELCQELAQPMPGNSRTLCKKEYERQYSQTLQQYYAMAGPHAEQFPETAPLPATPYQLRQDIDYYGRSKDEYFAKAQEHARNGATAIVTQRYHSATYQLQQAVDLLSALIKPGVRAHHAE